MSKAKSRASDDLDDIAALLARMRAGERRAISRAVTELERLSAAAPRLLAAFQPHLGHAQVVGFTGPPGAGKSTLVNAYTRHIRAGRARASASSPSIRRARSRAAPSSATASA